jgi:hypothetical protein
VSSGDLHGDKGNGRTVHVGFAAFGETLVPSPGATLLRGADALPSLPIRVASTRMALSCLNGRLSRPPSLTILKSPHRLGCS